MFSLISKKTTTTFDRVWHAGLCATMGKYNINEYLVRATEHQHDKAMSAVKMSGNAEEWFRTTVGVQQGYLL